MTSRRRPSTGPPSNPRYQLMTPDNDRESFLDIPVYDGVPNLNPPRDHLVYPTYQQREKSPAPQVVRVAKQPEMIRRQSLRPVAGHWGTFDANPVVSDANLPGYFHDTEPEDLESDIIEAIPRTVPFGYSHPADMTDLYSEVSDEDLDVGHDESIVFPQLPIEDVFAEVAYVLRMKSNPTSQGFAYVLADPTGRSKFYKIGSSKNASRKANEHRSICSLSFWGMNRRPATPIREYKRLEKLAHAELMNFSYDPNCICATQHGGYFWGREQSAFDVLEFWAKWFAKHAPYSKGGLLLPFWDHRLKAFEADLVKYFNCGSPNCTRHTPDAMACQACLRAGWKAWAEPSSSEKIDYATRTQIGIEWVHRVLIYLHQYLPIPEKYVLTFVDCMAWTIFMWGRFKHPTLLLNLMYARLLIPLLWSSIFTTADYIPVVAIFEIVLFSVIYQLVRRELLQVYRRVSQPQPVSGSASTKPVLAILDNSAEAAAAGRSTKPPKAIDISEDEVQNVTKQATMQTKGNGKKMAGISTLFPGEATARLRRMKTGRRRSDFV